MHNNYGIKMLADFDTNESLLTHGIVDSFGLFAFIADLQHAFNIPIEDREIHPGNFETIENIVRFIYAKKEDEKTQ